MQLKQLELAGGGTLTVYLRDCCERMPNVLDRPLVLVVPGGGYTHVSAREGDPVALQFAAAGYHTAVLDYAICEKAKDYMPLRQLAEAIGLVRQHAAQWHILPEKIAVCGFSAGGHLALSGAVLDIPGEAAQPRPNAVILGYPVVTAGQYAHRGSFVQLAGSADPAAQQVFGLEDKITPQTPPVFVWTTMEDATVPVENTLMLVNALHRAGVPCEAHLFEKGGARYQHQHGRGGPAQPPPASLGGTGSGMAGRHFCLFRLLSLDIFERTYKKFTIKLLTCISL